MGMTKTWALVLFGLLTQLGCRKISDGSKLRSPGETIPAEGLFAKQVIFASKSTAAGLTITTKTERLQLVTLSQLDGRIEVKAKNCGLRSVSSGGSELSFPAAFVSSIPDSSYLLEKDLSGGKTFLKSPKLVEVFGARLNDTTGEALPKSKTDPRVFDQDKDGHPGMSVNLKIGIGPFSAGGQVYIVQRAAWRELATSVSNDSLSGTLEVSLDQETLGSDSSILGSVSAKVEALAPLSSFALKRLPERASCETVLKEAQKLFGPLKL